MTDQQVSDFLGRLTGHNGSVASVFTDANDAQARAADFAKRLASPLPRETGHLSLPERQQSDGRTDIFRDATPAERAE